MRRWQVTSRTPAAEILIEVAALLETGSVVAIPTETYYGLAAHYLRQRAHERVFALKGRGVDQPLLLLVESADWARRLSPAAPDELETLAAAFWPGPLTLVVPALPGLPSTLLSRQGNVAIRQTSHPVAQAIVRAVGAPITGTSANRSGAPAVQRAGQIELAAGKEPDAIVDAGCTAGGAASTLLLLGNDGVRVLRDGVVNRSRLKSVLGNRLL